MHQCECNSRCLFPQMQMRFDGLLGFPGGFVNLQKETLETGLSRELWEELGVAIPISVEDHVVSCLAPALFSSTSSSCLITHLYVKRMEEEQILEVERAAASTAKDHGHEVLGMIRVPLYTIKGEGGLASFLSHSFIGNARSQLVESLLQSYMPATSQGLPITAHAYNLCPFT
uniref:U8 snoRNA-decapping enzyme n=1 Tax=Mola mola TaxID=94237 RepID=A0A3Q4BX08_MOLML